MRLSAQPSKNWFRDFEAIRKDLYEQRVVDSQYLRLNQIDTPEFIKQQERVSLYGFVFALRWFEDCNKGAGGGLPQHLEMDLQRLCQSKDHDPKYLKKFLEAMHQHYMHRYGIDAKKSEVLMFYIRDIFMSGIDELDPIIEYQSVKLNVQGQKLRGDIGGNLPDHLPQGQALLNHLLSALNGIVKKNQIQLEDTHYKGRQLPPSFTRADKGMKSPAFSNDPNEIIPVATRRVNFDNELCAIQTLAASPAGESQEVVEKRFKDASNVFQFQENRFDFLFQDGVDKPEMKLMMRLLNPSVLQTFLGGES